MTHKVVGELRKTLGSRAGHRSGYVRERWSPKVQGQSGAVGRRAGEAVVLFAGRNCIFLECGHTLAVAVVEGGWVRGSRRDYGWKIIQKNLVD